MSQATKKPSNPLLQQHFKHVLRVESARGELEDVLVEVSMVSTCLLHEKESADGHEHGHFRESCTCIFHL